ncbi:MAG: hypothetical protein QOE28_118 [Solirubrobacteraceae bacterium]|jgi:hypothetical protein|nr:hypothetical protein [Solirubrobacteraceae bacterium]
MVNARVETTTALDGSPLVQAIFDLSETEVAGAAHAVNASRTEQFRDEELSADAVLAMRELTALADELTSLGAHGSACTLALRPARLVALRDTLDAFAAAREEAGFMREDDRPAYAIAVALAGPLADLGEQALRAALDAAAHAGA